MTYRNFINGLCDAGINASTNGYQLRKALGVSTASLRLWLKEGLPCERNEKGHMVIDAQECICWLVNTGRVQYAGRLHDHFLATN